MICPYINPKTGAPCLKAAPHEPHPHITMCEPDGTPVTEIIDLDDLDHEFGWPA